MEEKKILNEEKIEDAAGGRLYEIQNAQLDLSGKEAFLNSVKSLEPKPVRIPEELLGKISGGSVFGGPLDDWDTDYLDLVISDYKAYGVDLESVLRYMMDCNLSNEAMWYVGTHW